MASQRYGSRGPGGWGAKKFPPGLLFAAGTGGAESPTIHSAEMPIPNLRGRRLRTAMFYPDNRVIRRGPSGSAECVRLVSTIAFRTPARRFLFLQKLTACDTCHIQLATRAI